MILQEVAIFIVVILPPPKCVLHVIMIRLLCLLRPGGWICQMCRPVIFIIIQVLCIKWFQIIIRLIRRHRANYKLIRTFRKYYWHLPMPIIINVLFVFWVETVLREVAMMMIGRVLLVEILIMMEE